MTAITIDSQLEDFFDLKVWIDGVTPKHSLKLKAKYTEGKPFPKGSNGMPLSPSKSEYFAYFIGDDKAQLVYGLVKPFFSKRKVLLYAKEKGLLTEPDWLLVEAYWQTIDAKMKEKHTAAINEPAYRAKLKAAYNHQLHSDLKKAWHKNPGNRARFIEATQNQDSKKRRVVAYKNWLSNGGYEQLLVTANTPERKQKISTSSKLMWAKAKETNDVDKLDKWFKSRFSRNYQFENWSMTSIEYMVATMLDAMHATTFQYEPCLCIDGIMFRPDFLLSGKVIIECYGDFWHANPKRYQANSFMFEGMTASDIWSKDSERVLTLEKNGYTVFALWESDILNDKQTITETIKKAIEATNENTNNA
jgi:G:T-mismatch repair DNA endonuclease (very short patch repair protein)